MIPHGGMPLVEWLIAWAMVVVVPLGLRLGRTPRHGLALTLASAALGVGALFVEDRALSAALVAPYLLNSLRLAAHALNRLLQRGLCAEALLDIGQLELPVAAGWLLASRAGWDTGYDPAITALTAAHFHYAGFAAATVTGVVLRGVRAPWTGPVIALGPPLVGLGIALSPAVEVLSATLLAAGMLGLAWAMVRLDRRLTVAALPLLFTMALALTWALQEFTGHHWLLLPRMAQLHGVLNALGFATLGLLLLNLRSPSESRALPAVPPLPSLRPLDGPPPVGLYSDLKPLGMDTVPPEIARYQLDSTSVTLLLRPHWRWRPLGRLAHRLTRGMGNLVMPHEDCVHRVSNRLLPLQEGWVHSLRTYADGSTMYALAYGRHEHRMRVVAPLPLGALDSLLVASSTPEHPHLLESEGLYWVWGPLRVRLPLHERLEGRAEQGHFLAHHRFRLLGVEILRLDYAIAPEPKDSLLA